MGVMWVWNIKTPETGDMTAVAVDWREASRRSVDEIVNRMRLVGRGRISSKKTACPECSYITRSVSFPAKCIYCGSPLRLL